MCLHSELAARSNSTHLMLLAQRAFELLDCWHFLLRHALDLGWRGIDTLCVLHRERRSWWCQRCLQWSLWCACVRARNLQLSCDCTNFQQKLPRCSSHAARASQPQERRSSERNCLDRTSLTFNVRILQSHVRSCGQRRS
jgi:hypothetical protein